MWEEIRLKVLHSGSKLNLLIGINVAVFLVLGLLGILETLSTTHNVLNQTLYNYLAVPSYLPTLLTRFWTPLTYMFMHAGIWHIVMNMIWFYWMGQIFEEYLGGKKLLNVYFLGGLVGAVFFIVAYNVFPLFAAERNGATAVGASASIMAVIVGTATLLPNYTIFLFIFGEVRLKWLAIVFVIFDLFGLVGSNAGGAFAHLGGAFLGFIYIRQLQKGNDIGAWFGKLFKPKSKLKVVYKNSKNTNTKPQQDEIDRILDKISNSGLDSLSKQERDTLSKASDDDKS
ncbi:rhomboid family intramembrane serine protease [Mucilaginibacter sp. HMF5004]|uniref:rhomboid family protein n=1 Tax=Mucilaginibacter rivuli TaxID=2857527 RepID=UPI001C5EF408|nr:rhomboid family intramembrane serine protease [Mucilaginibacter rivuli]MBW4891185.1 rhomboid family intramembrane serine protease [Mucilaginibacter rivuli]